MDVIRYDGVRFITEEEIDREFTGKWVLVTTENINAREGYLVAVAADNESKGYGLLSDLAIDEFDAKTKIIYGCKKRGGSLHVTFREQPSSSGAIC